MTSSRKVKVLVANRGEIAVRVMRACHELGMSAVAVYSDADRDALHVRSADEAWYLGPSPAKESYLRIDRLVEIAGRAGATLVHPGYGFLAENEEFAQACLDRGLTFVGPSPEAIRRMGHKALAREAAVAAGVPVVPGSGRAFAEEAPDALIADEAERLGYPILVKAVAGGGGKGMRTVTSADALSPSVRLARSEAQSAFGDGSVYLERRLVGPRHIEIQLLADAHGTIRAFVERECSIQRRHQKVVEESPSTAVPLATRAALADAACRIAREVGYTNAGTIEFLLDTAGDFYFLEMNTRLQVEHPVTEAVTGIDLVQWQIKIALGAHLTVSAEEAMTPRGHAIECRVYAEDPDTGFMPSPGVIQAISVPGGPGVRDDRGVAAGAEVSLYYDSLLAKLVVWGPTRLEAIARLRRVLAEYRVVGVKTTLPFFQWLVEQEEFSDGRFSTTYLDEVLLARQGRPFFAATPRDEEDALIAVAIASWMRTRRASGPPRSTGDLWQRAGRLERLK